MLLTVDIGNTNITLGIFDNDKFIEEFRLASDKDLCREEYEILLKSLCKGFEITECVIGSVVEELNTKIFSAIKNIFAIDALFVSHEIETGIKIKIDKPETLGADRIANAIGASIQYKTPVIVIDFGTATTFDIINRNNEFVGGLIAPGLNLQIKSLNKFTSKLPRIEVALSNRAIATNTEEAILSGVIRGSACMIDGLIEQCEQELGEKATIIATGGYSGLIANYLKRPFDKIDPTLTLYGLKEFKKLNTKRKEQCI